MSEKHKEPLLSQKKSTRVARFGADVAAALVGFVLTVPGTISYAGLASARLPSTFNNVVVITFLSVAIGTPVFKRSAFITLPTTDPLAGAFFVEVSAIVEKNLQDEPGLQGPHAVVLFAMFSFGFGLLSCVSARMKVGTLLRFMPFTVTGGLLGGFGLIIMYSGWGLALGTSPADAAGAVLSSHWLPLLRTGAMLLVAAGLSLLRRCKALSAAALPCVIVAATLLFYLVPERYRADGRWYLPDISGADPRGPFDALSVAFSQFRAGAVFNAEALTLFLTFFGVIYINWGLHIPIMAGLVKTKEDQPVDLNNEIDVAGLASCLAGAIGGHPIGHAMGTPIQVQNIGNDHWPMVMGLLVLVATVTNAWTLVAVVPRFVFGGTTFTYGFNLAVEWMVHSKNRIAQNEWYLLVFSSAAIFMNTGLGLVIGMLLSLACFMIEYAGMSGIKQRSSMRFYRSAIERSPADNSTLAARGGDVHIFWMHGYLFFGSIARVVDEVLEATSCGARWVVIDLALVPAIDAAGVHNLVELSRILEQKSVKLLVTGMVRRLALAVCNSGRVASAVTLDAGLEVVEDEILMAAGGFGKRTESCLPPANITSVDEAWAVASRHLHPRVVSPDDWQRVAAVSALRVHDAGPLFAEGDTVADLLLLMHGVVQIECLPVPSCAVREMPRWHLNAEKGDRFVFEERPQRIRTTHMPGAAINPMECARAVCGHPAVALASAQALTKVQLLAVPFASIDEGVLEGFLRQWVLSTVVGAHASSTLANPVAELATPMHAAQVAPNVLLRCASML